MGKSKLKSDLDDKSEKNYIKAKKVWLKKVVLSVTMTAHVISCHNLELIYVVDFQNDATALTVLFS